MRKIYSILIAGALMILSIFGAHTANARSNYQSTYNTNYGAHTLDCTLCHPNGNTSMFTAAGSAFGPSHNYAAIAPAPTVTGFTIPATSTSLTVPITTFTATDNPLSPLSPITGYMVTESATPPSYNAAGWSATAPTSYTFPTAGTKTLYAWALDYVYVVSASKSASTTITLSSQPPVIDSFTATPSSITSGQSSTLAWTLSGGAPTTLSIDSGVGSVLGSTSGSVKPSVTTTYTLTASNSGGSVQAQVTVTVSASPSPGISFWSMFIGSSWVYDGSTVSGARWTYRKEVTSQDTTTIPGVETYVVSGFEGTTPWDKQWVSINSSEMREWRIDDFGPDGTTILIDGGLLLAKNPVIVGDEWVETTTGTLNGSPITLSVTTTVQSFDSVTVSLGTFEAYKIHRVIIVPGVATITEDRWFVPYIGFIKSIDQTLGEEAETEVLSSMVLNGFTDVSYLYWAYDYIMAIYDAGITVGCAQNNPGTPENERRYCPEENVTREQMAAFIVRAVEGEPPSNYCDTGDPFPDVTPDMFFCRYIKRLYELEITTGYSDGTYGPQNNVSREEMATFIVRAVEGEPPTNYCDSGSLFPDVTPDMWSCRYIKRLKELEITTGYKDGTYGPYDLVTRDQMAAFLSRAFLGME